MAEGVGAWLGAGALVLDLIDAASPAAAVASEEGSGDVLVEVLVVVATSDLTIRPPGPVPVTLVRSTPRSVAILRASGDDLMRFPSKAVPAGEGVAVEETTNGFVFTGVASVVFGVIAGVSSLPPPRIARTLPMLAFSPSWIRILVRIPSSKASISIVALSVSISARMSPISTESPTCLCHLIRVPSVIVSESLGISMVTDMVLVGMKLQGEW